MKKILIIATLLLSSLWGSAQVFPIDTTTKLITYTDIINVKQTGKNELFMRASRWFAKTYQSGNLSWQSADIESGKIVAKVRLNTQVKYFVGTIDGGSVFYTIELSCKDNRFRYKFTDFYHVGKDADNRSGGALENTVTQQNYISMPTRWNEIREQVDALIRLQIESLINAMNTNSDSGW